MRLFLISDTHFGVRNNSKEWLEIQENYFRNFFIPNLKQRVKEGDILLHLGDVFDNRTSINLNVMNVAYKIFEEISKIIPVHIIVGNHDIYNKKTNEINSLLVFKNIKNIHIYETPTVIKLGNKFSALLMPWVENVEDFNNFLENPLYESDFLFCHTDINNLKFNKNSIIENGINQKELYKFKRVFSGHIHWGQKIGNIHMIGNPYELTRSDGDNIKKIVIYDLETDEEEWIENNYTPKFKKIHIDYLLNHSLEELSFLMTNNFVDILIPQTKVIDIPIQKLLEYLNCYIISRKINIKIYDENLTNNNFLEESNNIETFSIESLIKTYIDTTNYSDDLKEKLKIKSLEIFTKYKENRNEDIKF